MERSQRKRRLFPRHPYLSPADEQCGPLRGKGGGHQRQFPDRDGHQQLDFKRGKPLFPKDSQKKNPGLAPRLDLLPPELIAAFERTFSYTQTTVLTSAKRRTTAEEWNRLLLTYAKAEPNPALRTCQKNPSHVYPAHHTSCPFCRYAAAAARRGFLYKIKDLFKIS